MLLRSGLAAALALLSLTCAARATDFPRPRISLAVAQGAAFLDGGYADAGAYYSLYWETGQTWSLHASLDVLPVLRTGLHLGLREFEDRGFGIDDLHTGHARLALSVRLPLELEAAYWTNAAVLHAVRGPVAYLRVEAGFGVVDPTSDTFGGLYDRTFTYSVALVVGLELRLEEIGLFLEGGMDLLGAPRASAGFSAEPDPILSFPLAAGLRVYVS